MKVFFHLFVLWKVEAMPLFISDSHSSFFPLISQTNAKAATGEPSLLRFTYLILSAWRHQIKNVLQLSNKSSIFPHQLTKEDNKIQRGTNRGAVLKILR